MYISIRSPHANLCHAIRSLDTFNMLTSERERLSERLVIMSRNVPCTLSANVESIVELMLPQRLGSAEYVALRLNDNDLLSL